MMQDRGAVHSYRAGYNEEHPLCRLTAIRPEQPTHTHCQTSNFSTKSQSRTRATTHKGTTMTWPSIDHTLLSPSGKVSKRARKAAMDRETARLFPEGLERPKTPQPSEKDVLLRRAREWRDLAARGMQPRKHTQLAEAAEARANAS